jgi:hypothetical protein
MPNIWTSKNTGPYSTGYAATREKKIAEKSPKV